MEINGECGKKTYSGVSKLMIEESIHGLWNNGAYVSEDHPWTVVTHRSGVVLQGYWNAQEESLDLIILKKNFDVSCEAIWETIDHLLNNVRSEIQNPGMNTAV